MTAGTTMPPQRRPKEEEDRLSMLTDDILLSILRRVNPRMAVRTSVLSTRWRHLPWLLHELTIDVKDFLSDPCPDPIEANHMEEAMASLTKATRSFLANQLRESTVSTLDLRLYLINTFVCELGPLVGNAVCSGQLKGFDLAVLDETDPRDSSDESMLQRAEQIDGFFSAYPSVLHCLTRLFLQNVNFEKFDMHHVLFDCCKELEHLSLCQCDAGLWSLFKIDAPNSKLRFLELTKCHFGRLEMACLPKLEKFSWDIWLWILPEMKQLCTAFSKLRKLYVRGIFVEFDILWMLAFLAAAPSIEMLHIEVWKHPCDVDDDREGSFSERRTPHWEMDSDGSKNLLLKELEFIGFRLLEQQFTFVRSVLERSPNLEKIVLKGEEQCDYCSALDVPSKFPKKDEQEMVARRISDGTFVPQIIFDE